MADPANHTWAIAMATSNTLLPPHTPPLRDSGAGLNFAACHILLALYLNNRGLHLLDPHLADPHIPAPAPEALAVLPP